MKKAPLFLNKFKFAKTGNRILRVLGYIPKLLDIFTKPSWYLEGMQYTLLFRVQRGLVQFQVSV